ncbi:MAG: Dam family site-specific DNA-(adenine-N6)-methyltransferase [Bacteroidales bacterium]|nr:Dam family site-specific DNA-(adenine-N6)-methyltransferase [Bacteroidales bacterium]MCD8395393.1 Dam family site-specific DNA-(adenine-N6)-methyltransferase [Bacteroidales bacterium]
MKPMVKYRGGKSKEIPHIMLHIPRFSGRYVEPFLGGGALFFHLEPRQSIVNDINTKLIEFYRGVRDEYNSLRQELDLVEKQYALNRAEFDRLKALDPNKRVEDKNEGLYYALRDMYNGIAPRAYSEALLYYFINKTAYSGMIRYNAKGEFNVPFGRYQHLNTSKVTLDHSRLLQRSEIYNTDYSRIFDMCQPDDFVFLDPPYDCIFSDYGNDEYKNGFGEQEHIRLANDFRNLPCKALMVIGRTPLIEELYHGYIVDEYSKNYAVNIRNRFKSQASHLVIANYRRQWISPSNYKIEQPEHAQLALFEAETPYGTH